MKGTGQLLSNPSFQSGIPFRLQAGSFGGYWGRPRRCKVCRLHTDSGKKLKRLWLKRSCLKQFGGPDRRHKALVAHCLFCTRQNKQEPDGLMVSSRVLTCPDCPHLFHAGPVGILSILFGIHVPMPKGSRTYAAKVALSSASGQWKPGASSKGCCSSGGP